MSNIEESKKTQSVLTVMAKSMRPSQEEWEKLGFVFLDVPGDDILYYATMPEGWSMRRTEHPLWTEIIDKNENVRGSMFYKSKPYERESRMSLRARYRVFSRYLGENYSTKEICFGNSDEILFVAGSYQVKRGSTREEREALLLEDERLKALAEQFGNDNYPGWQEIDSYWENDKQNSNGQASK